MRGHTIAGEQGVQKVIKLAPLRGPSVRVSVVDVLPTFTTCGHPVTKSRIQLQREVFNPRVFRLMMFFLSKWESAIEIASSVDLLGRYAYWRGSRVSGRMLLM